MVVADLNIVGVAVKESKTDPPLIVDGNGMLPFPIILERMQAISGRHLEVVEPGCQLHVFQLAGGACGDVSGGSVLPAPS